MIKITEKTRNTPALRLKIYKEALNIIINNSVCGFCFKQSITPIVMDFPNFNPYRKGIMENYPELSKYEPTSHDLWWFNGTPNPRIKILKKVIKEMEDAKKK